MSENNTIEFPISYEMYDRLIRQEINFEEKLDKANKCFSKLEDLIKLKQDVELFAQFSKCVDSVQELLKYIMEEYR